MLIALAMLGVGLGLWVGRDGGPLDTAAPVPEHREPGPAPLVRTSSPERPTPFLRGPRLLDLTVTGRVTAPDGRPLPGVSVRWRPGPGGGAASRGDGVALERHVITDASGDYELVLPGLSKAGTLEVAHSNHAREVVPLSERVAERRGAVELRVDAVLAPSGSLAGRVVDADDGQPLRGIQVLARRGRPPLRGCGPQRCTKPEEQVEVTTDAGGLYRFDPLAPDEWYVLVSRGQTSYAEPPLDSALRVVVNHGSNVTDVDFELAAGGVLEGRVVDPEGEPVSGARVHVHRPRGQPRGDQARAGDTDGVLTATDDTGWFHTAGLNLDTPYDVVASAPGLALGIRRGVAVPAATRRLELSIRLERGFSVAGVVRADDSERPLPGVLVRLRQGDTPWADGVAQRWTDEEGGFVFVGLSSGTYQLGAWHPDALTNRPPGVAKRVVVTNGEIRGLGIYLGPPRPEDRLGKAEDQASTRTFQGEVVDDDGGPIAGALVAATVVTVNGASYTTRAISGPAGRFVVQLADGLPVTLDVTHRKYEQVVRTTYPPDAGDVIVMLSRYAIVEGEASDGNDRAPETSLQVAVVPLGDPPPPRGDRRWKTGRPDGAFRLLRVPTGAVEIVAHVPGYAPARSAPLRLSPGERVTGVRVRLRRGGRISGRVVVAPEQGAPQVEVAAVRVTGQTPPTLNQLAGATTTITDADGFFALEHLPAGRWRLVAWDRQAAHAPTEPTLADLPEDGHREVGVMPLRRAGRLEGYVTSGDQPLAGATVRLFSEADVRRSESAGDGSFAVAGLAAGQYLVVVEPAADGGGRTRGTRNALATVRAGAATKVELAFGDGRAIEGKPDAAVGAEGFLVRLVVGGAPVLAVALDPPLASAWTVAESRVALIPTAPGGGFTISDVIPGIYELEIYRWPAGGLAALAGAAPERVFVTSVIVKQGADAEVVWRP